MAKTQRTKKLTLLAIFTGASLLMFLIENQFPPLFVPGAKMGLANLFSLLALVLFGWKEALLLIVCRTILGSFFSNPFALLYSFTAGVAAIGLSSLLYATLFPRISLLAISVTGALVHNLVQNAVFVLVTRTPEMFVYAPYLALVGILSGLIVGAALLLLLKKIPLSVYRKAIGSGN